MKNAAANNMVLGQIITNDVLDPNIIKVLKETPREEYVPESLRNAAYADNDLDIGNGRALMAPMTFAKLLHLAEIEPTSRVLNIGCLSGYTAVVLSKLASHVVATETDKTFLDQARANIARLGISNIGLQEVKSLAEGCAASAPYDVIIIGGAIQFLPDAIGSQLIKGGRLVAVHNIVARPGVGGGSSRGMVMRRIDNQLQSREYFDTGAMLLPGFAREEKFSF